MRGSLGLERDPSVRIIFLQVLLILLVAMSGLDAGDLYNTERRSRSGEREQAKACYVGTKVRGTGNDSDGSNESNPLSLTGSNLDALEELEQIMDSERRAMKVKEAERLKAKNDNPTCYLTLSQKLCSPLIQRKACYMESFKNECVGGTECSALHAGQTVFRTNGIWPADMEPFRNA